MDLGPICGLNSRFGAVWEGFATSPRWVRSPSLSSLVYQRVTSGGFSDILEDSAPALPVIGGHLPITCRSGVIVAWAELRVCAGGHWMV
jgi:hypothetical protein